MKKILAILLVLIFTFSSCNLNNKKNLSENDNPTESNDKKVIAAWIYYNEIEEFVRTADTESDFKANIEKAIDKLSDFSVNTVIIHVRAFDDAFYKSNIFPVSRYCADDDGKLKFDVLKCFADVCRSRNIKLWGWVNPYRINKVDDTSVIQEGFFQSEALNSDNKQLLIHSKNGVYYNPADSNVKRHIIDGIREILENYDIDGIHFDDYFYPSTETDFDSNYYEKYKAGGGELSLSDFRRENVNSLIYSVCALVRKYNKVFSVSPISNIEGNIKNYYADVRLWATSDSYVDYIIPQIYFGFQNPIQPFADTLKKWVDLTGDSEKLLIGLAVYKSGISDNYAKDGKDEWKNRDVISKEIEYILKNYENIGFVYYSASFLYNPQDEGINTEISNIKRVLNSQLPSSVT